MPKHFLKSILILILIIFLLLSSYIIILLVGGDRVLNFYKEKIIKKYDNNEDAFIDSINEILSEESNMYFNVTNSGVIIEICVKDDNVASGVSYIKLDEKNYNKYNKTLKLMNKLKIKRIIKDIDYIGYNFGSPYGNGQWIMYTNDINKYILEQISNGYEFHRFERIKKNWYFIEES